MSGRTVHAIRIQLQGMADRSVIVWPKTADKLCLSLVNPRRTWLTTRRGDSVTLKHNGKQSREYVDGIELYRVFPAHFNGTEVESARAWVDAGGVQ